MQDAGGADTIGSAMLITSAVAILFSFSSGDTRRSDHWPVDWTDHHR